MRVSVTNVAPADKKPVTNAEWEGLFGKILSIPEDHQRDVFDAMTEAMQGAPQGATNRKVDLGADRQERRPGPASSQFKLPKAD
jgi:hypothetical protein